VGGDSFTYRANDGSLESGLATVLISVTPVNDAPVALDQSVSTPEDTAKAIVLSGSDLDGDAISFGLLDGPSHGSLSGFDPLTGDVLYTPATNYVGGDSFTFRVNDGQLDSAPATVSIEVTPVNDAPVALDDSYSTPEDTLLSVALPGVLGNDSDVDGDGLSAVLVDDVSHGTLSLNGDGSFTYQPQTNYVGGDSFTYRANDGSLESGLATVLISVTPVNDAPEALDQSVSTPEDTAKAIVLSGSDLDGDAISFGLLDGPSHGSLSGFDLDSAPATVSIEVTPVRDPLITPEDGGQYSVFEDGLLEVAAPGLLNGIVNVEGDPLSVVMVSGTTNGVLQVNADGSFTYQPDADYFGMDGFTFLVSDGTTTSGDLSATIQVLPVNDAPMFTAGASPFHQIDAPSQTFSNWATAISAGPANEADQAVWFQVTTDNPSLFAQPPRITPDGTLQYAPAAGQFGVATVSVMVADSGGTANGGTDVSEPQTFTITVNSPPLVRIVSPTNGATFIVPANFTLAADALDPDGTITRLELYESTNRLATFTNTGPYVTVLTDLEPGIYEFNAYAEDDRGASAWSGPTSVTVLDAPPITVIGPPKLNLNTGLFEQRVRITNPSYYEIQGVLVLVNDLPTGAVVVNATGERDGIPFVRSVSALPAGGELYLTLEYYVPTSDFPNPTLTTLMDEPAQTVVQYAGLPQHIHRGLMRSDGGFMLEFETLADRLYVIEYSADLTEWISAQPPVVGDGALYQWIDHGQPKTLRPPGEDPARFYRLILLP